MKNLISETLINVVKYAGLHTQLAALEGQADFNMYDTARKIGEQVYIKRAEAKKINEGIKAFAALKKA